MQERCLVIVGGIKPEYCLVGVTVSWQKLDEVACRRRCAQRDQCDGNDDAQHDRLCTNRDVNYMNKMIDSICQSDVTQSSSLARTFLELSEMSIEDDKSSRGISPVHAVSITIGISNTHTYNFLVDAVSHSERT